MTSIPLLLPIIYFKQMIFFRGDLDGLAERKPRSSYLRGSLKINVNPLCISAPLRKDWKVWYPARHHVLILGRTPNPSLIFSVWWTAIVSNLLNQSENDPQFLCFGSCDQTNFASAGVGVSAWGNALIWMFFFVCAPLQCCLPGWILWCRHLCKYSLTCMPSLFPPESFFLQVCCKFLYWVPPISSSCEKESKGVEDWRPAHDSRRAVEWVELTPWLTSE